MFCAQTNPAFAQNRPHLLPNHPTIKLTIHPRKYLEPYNFFIRDFRACLHQRHLNDHGTMLFE